VRNSIKEDECGKQLCFVCSNRDIYSQANREEPGAVEKVGEHIYCCHIAGPDGVRGSGAVTVHFMYVYSQFSCDKPLKRKLEIGKWKTSRHKIFRILS